MTTWSDIRTAPRDGSRIVGLDQERGTLGFWPEVVCAWSSDIQSFADEEGYPVSPTRWMPL